MTQNTHTHPKADTSLNFIEEGEQRQNNHQKQEQSREHQKAQEQQEHEQRVFLQKIYKQFRVVKDEFYFKDQSDRIAFKDKGQRIVSTLNDDRVTQGMITLAQAKGWQSIKVSGHSEFQRKIWLDASGQGIEVQGYKPTEQDLDELQKTRRVRAENTIEKTPDPANDTIQNKDRDFTSHQQSVFKKENDIDLTMSKSLPQNNQDKDDINSSQRTNQTEGRIYKGHLLDHGAAKFNHDQNENNSYYVKLATNYGEKTVWGVDLNRAIAEGDVKPGDDITLEFKGQKDVTVQVPKRDETGKITGHEWIDTKRNTWDVNKSDKVKIVEAVASTFINTHIKDPQHREMLKGAIENRLLERQKFDAVSSVAIYDKTAPRQELEQAQTTPKRQHDLERTRS